MRHSSEAAIEERGLRDVDRWKDKIEVRLDNRQVFFLFFGSALVACLLFVLGVIVGKRLESRGKAVAPEIEDPLALLDKVATAPAVGQLEPAAPLPRTLLGGIAAATRRQPPAAKLPPAPVAPPAAKPALTAEKAIAALAPKPRTEEEAPAPRPAAPAPAAVVPRPAPVAAAPPTPVAPSPEAAAARPGRRFTLQLGSFPDRAEAEAFAKRFGGTNPYVIPAEVPGKGTWYRVRVGDYPSSKDAVAAKNAFEKQHSVIAYVVPPAPVGPVAAPPARTSAPR